MKTRDQRADDEERRKVSPRGAVLSYLATHHPVLSAAATLLVLVTAIMPSVLILMTSYVATQAYRDGGLQHGHDHLLEVVAGIAVLLVVLQVMVVARQACTEALGRRLDMEFRDRLAAAVCHPAGVSHLEGSTRTPELDTAMGVMNRLGGPAGGLMGLAGQTSDLLSAAVCLTLVVRATLPGGLIACAACLGAAVVTRRDLGRRALDGNLTGHQLRRVDYIRDLVMRPGAEKEVQLFGIDEWLRRRHDQEWRKAAATAWSSSGTGRSALVAGATVLAGCTAAVAFVYQAWTLGQTGTFALIAALQSLVIVLPLVLVGDNDRLAIIGWESVGALFRTVERLAVTSPALASAAETAPAPDPDSSDITFVQVCFSYPGGPQVLDHLNVTIPGGKTTAIVGENGAGKSTILALLARFYDPTEGEILWGGTPIAGIPPDAWRDRLSTVMQHPMRLPLSMADNIAWGNPSTRDEQALSLSLQDAGLTPVVGKLPRGIATVLTHQINGGVDLSGGEWQKVGLARGLFALRTGAGILALDEPTAAMDIESERDVYEAIMRLTIGRTTILVSHRFATVRKADHIVVLDSGHVVEQGSHEELLAAGGRYAKMFKVQSEMYA